jgi:ABC-type uncharacterized transport system involved in gliding motility auxiliary subunit
MATDLPKIQGYLPQPIYDALVAYRDANNLKSTSLAVTKALSEFFGVSCDNSPANQSESLATRVEFLEGK